MALLAALSRVNGDLFAYSNALIEDLGVNSARRPVLRAIALSPMPLPVANHARNMGLTRQNTPHLVDEVQRGGLVRLDLSRIIARPGLWR